MIWNFTMPGECRKASWERETEIPYPVVFPPSIAPQFNESNWELRVLFKGLGRQASCIIFVILLHQHHLLKFSSAGESPAESHLREPLPKASEKNYIALIPFRSLFPTISFPPHHTPLPINSPVHKRRLPLERCHGAFARSSELPPFSSRVLSCDDSALSFFQKVKRLWKPGRWYTSQVARLETGFWEKPR